MDTDRNLLFGVLALQADLIDADRFARACGLWCTQKATPLADVLMQQGWLTAEDRADVERLLDRKLRKHSGDIRAGLAEATTDQVKQSLASLAEADVDVRQSLSGAATPPTAGLVLLSTTNHDLSTRERYTLSRLHATGGIGRVWLARDASLGRDVALKELRPERAGNAAIWARFLKEAQVTGQLEHPGIVPIYEVGRRPEDQQPFYTMRFVRGRTLAEASASYHERKARGAANALDQRELLTAFVGVCNAVAYAHSRGVLHRDLKPQNVVLGDFGEVIVLDWGLAKVLNQKEQEAAPLQGMGDDAIDATMQGQVLGTPAYMPPEQAEGRLDQLGPTSDVYGLGAILYDVLTGRAPFVGDDTSAVLHKVVHESLAPPRSINPGVPLALEAVCLKALTKQPRQRYGTAKELGLEVQRWLADEPVSAFREPFSQRAWRWVKRRRVLVTSVAAAGVVALVGLVVVLVLQTRSNAQLAEANGKLAAANEREKARFDLAMEAIGAYHTGVSEDVLLKQAQFKELRERLLSGAAAFYNKLQKLLEGQDDSRSRQAVGHAYYHLGELTQSIGSKSAALEVQRQGLAVRRERAAAQPDLGTRVELVRSLLAVGLLEKATGDLTRAKATLDEAVKSAGELAVENPTDEAREVLALSHYDLGVLLEMTNPQDALASHERAKELLQRLADANPAAAQFQRELAACLTNIGTSQAQTNKLQAALESYEQARTIRQRLVDANPSVTQYQSDLAASYNNLGTLQAQRGQTRDQLAAYERAMAIHQKLVDDNPAVSQFQFDLAANYFNIGNVLSTNGEHAEALKSLERARDIDLMLVRANPSVTQYQDDLGGIYINSGNALTLLGRPKEALTAFEQARAIYEKLVEANPAVLPFQTNLAIACNNMANQLVQAGNSDAALQSYDRSRAILQKLADAYPTVTQYQSNLAAGHSAIGTLLLQKGKAEEALVAQERARDIRQKLLDANAGVPFYRNSLASSYTNAGAALYALKRFDKAQASYEQAIMLREGLVKDEPKTPLYRSHLAYSLKRRALTQQALGKIGEATADARRAVELYQGLGPRAPGESVELAGSLALLAGLAKKDGSRLTAVEGQTSADAAVEALRQAIVGGFRNREALRVDEALDPLRQREDFQKLMKDLEGQGH